MAVYTVVSPHTGTTHSAHATSKAAALRLIEFMTRPAPVAPRPVVPMPLAAPGFANAAD
jgi:hypothetical protein